MKMNRCQLPDARTSLSKVCLTVAAVALTTMSCLAAECYFQYSTLCCSIAEPRPSGRFCVGTWCPDGITGINAPVTDFRLALIGEKGKDDYNLSFTATCTWNESTCSGLDCGPANGPAHSQTCYSYTTSGNACDGTVTR